MPNYPSQSSAAGPSDENRFNYGELWGSDDEKVHPPALPKQRGKPTIATAAAIEAGVAAFNADFNCHDCPRSEIACIQNHIRGIKIWSETVEDTKLRRDMLARLESIVKFLDSLMDWANKNQGNTEYHEKLVGAIVKLRQDVVGIGLKAKKIMEARPKREELDLEVLEAMVKTFQGDVGKLYDL